MDVKTGNGAFADTYKMAQELAQSIADVATGSGVPTRCLITDMNQVLGSSVGNAVEVLECIDFLVSPTQADKRLVEITLGLAAHMLQISGIETNLDHALSKAQKTLNNGAAAETFSRMVSALGGPNDLLQTPQKYLKPMTIVNPIKSTKSGYVTAMDVRSIGMSMVSLKAGRSKATDNIDHGVGLTSLVQIGQWIEIDQPLAFVHLHNTSDVSKIERELSQAITLSDTPPKESDMIYEILTAHKENL
jgi:thymidine phosphorylase